VICGNEAAEEIGPPGKSTSQKRRTLCLPNDWRNPEAGFDPSAILS
jgi:hypothetical protein